MVTCKLIRLSGSQLHCHQLIANHFHWVRQDTCAAPAPLQELNKTWTTGHTWKYTLLAFHRQPWKNSDAKTPGSVSWSASSLQECNWAYKRSRLKIKPLWPNQRDVFKTFFVAHLGLFKPHRVRITRLGNNRCFGLPCCDKLQPEPP